MRRNRNKANEWGTETYRQIIEKAIRNSLEGRMRLGDIYTFMIENYPWFAANSINEKSNQWKNAVRHNLSIHKDTFTRINSGHSGKSSWWILKNNTFCNGYDTCPTQYSFCHSQQPIPPRNYAYAYPMLPMETTWQTNYQSVQMQQTQNHPHNVSTAMDNGHCGTLVPYANALNTSYYNPSQQFDMNPRLPPYAQRSQQHVTHNSPYRMGLQQPSFRPMSSPSIRQIQPTFSPELRNSRKDETELQQLSAHSTNCTSEQQVTHNRNAQSVKNHLTEYELKLKSLLESNSPETFDANYRAFWKCAQDCCPSQNELTIVATEMKNNSDLKLKRKIPESEKYVEQQELQGDAIVKEKERDLINKPMKKFRNKEWQPS